LFESHYLPDCPNEASQFPSNGGEGLHFDFSLGVEFFVPLAQPFLDCSFQDISFTASVVTFALFWGVSCLSCGQAVRPSCFHHHTPDCNCQFL